MTNREIAKNFQLLGQLMELHDENPFKVRSYLNAYLTLRKLPEPLSGMNPEDMLHIKGIGKAISEKIGELLETGHIQTLEKYKVQTPPGLIELMGLKGFGPKKIRQVWKELDIESAGELIYACQENRLKDLKGFGAKTQEDLKYLLEYFMMSSGKFLFAQVEEYGKDLLSEFRDRYPVQRFELSGDLCRCLPVVERIEIDCILITDATGWNGSAPEIEGFKEDEHHFYYKNIPVEIRQIEQDDFVIRHLQKTSSLAFFTEVLKRLSGKNKIHSEKELFQRISSPFVPAELREDPAVLDREPGWFDRVIREEHIKGVIHTHSTYSDGVNTIEEMSLYAKERGYQYLVISDHSKSAFYANGLPEDRLILQWQEIEMLNKKIPGFHIFKSIESDILYDGSLDYEPHILEQFDLVIASVHSNLKMTGDKANERLIAAIENPYTKILGHPTGRLLLSRQGYPINHKKIIEACAHNDVVIELNANPHRLDLDWTWIDYALKNDVMISINPDAHSTAGILDTRYGVLVARKAGLPVQMCLNAKSLSEFRDWLTFT